MSEELARRFLRVAESARPEDDPTLFATSFVYHDALGYPHDLEEAMAMRHGFLDAFPDALMTIEDSIVTDDRLFFRWHSTGTHAGAFLGVAPTNKQVTNRGITLLHVADGTVQEMWDYVDLYGLFQQMEAVPALG